MDRIPYALSPQCPARKGGDKQQGGPIRNISEGYPKSAESFAIPVGIPCMET